MLATGQVWHLQDRYLRYRPNGEKEVVEVILHQRISIKIDV